VIKWTIQSKNPTTQPIVKTLKDLLEKNLNTMTGGGFQIKVVEPGAVVAANGEWAALQQGTIEASFTTPVNNKAAFGSVAGIFVEYAGSPNPDADMAWYRFGDGMKLEQELIDKTPGFDKVKIVGMMAMSGAEVEIMTKSKLINTVDDFKGMKIRTFGDWGKVLEGFGAAVQGTPAGEVYEALQRGVLDGAELSDRYTNISFGMHEVAKNWYYPGVHAPAVGAEFYVNKDAWAKLPPAYQEMLIQLTNSALLDNFSLIPTFNAKATPTLLAAGVKLIEMPIAVQKALAKATDALWKAESAKDPFFKKVYDNQRAFEALFATYMKQAQPDMPMLLQ
jgi:TRAP-type mannitol/chloroaromatic compound transport system substrate-binding protein